MSRPGGPYSASPPRQVGSSRTTSSPRARTIAPFIALRRSRGAPMAVVAFRRSRAAPIEAAALPSASGGRISPARAIGAAIAHHATPRSANAPMSPSPSSQANVGQARRGSVARCRRVATTTTLTAATAAMTEL